MKQYKYWLIILAICVFSISFVGAQRAGRGGPDIAEGSWTQNYTAGCASYDPLSLTITTDGDNLIITDPDGGSVTLAVTPDGAFEGAFQYTNADGEAVTITYALSVMSNTEFAGTEIYSSGDFQETCLIQMVFNGDADSGTTEQTSVVEEGMDGGITAGRWAESYLGDCSGFRPILVQLLPRPDGGYTLFSETGISLVITPVGENGLEGLSEATDDMASVAYALTIQSPELMTGTLIEDSETCEVVLDLLIPEGGDLIFPPQLGDWQLSYTGGDNAECAQLPAQTVTLSFGDDGFGEDRYQIDSPSLGDVIILETDDKGYLFGNFQLFSDGQQSTTVLALEVRDDNLIEGSEIFISDAGERICNFSMTQDGSSATVVEEEIEPVVTEEPTDDGTIVTGAWVADYVGECAPLGGGLPVQFSYQNGVLTMVEEDFGTVSFTESSPGVYNGQVSIEGVTLNLTVRPISATQVDAEISILGEMIETPSGFVETCNLSINAVDSASPQPPAGDVIQLTNTALVVQQTGICESTAPFPVTVTADGSSITIDDGDVILNYPATGVNMYAGSQFVADFNSTIEMNVSVLAPDRLEGILRIFEADTLVDECPFIASPTGS